MTYTREALEALDKDALINRLLRQREVTETGDDNFKYGFAELKAEIAKLTEEVRAVREQWSADLRDMDRRHNEMFAECGRGHNEEIAKLTAERDAALREAKSWQDAAQYDQYDM